MFHIHYDFWTKIGSEYMSPIQPVFSQLKKIFI